ncbi:MAG: hypothetical protein KDD53_01595 [Bdellovibrionales bacterium]|nr:hypothetical protein [Bdellovibrionales bacterium]
MKTTKILIVAAFFLMLWVPLLNIYFGPIDRITLKGKTKRQTNKHASEPSLLDGSLQADIEKRALAKSKLRGYFVRTDNQINYSLFNQLNNNYKTGNILGANGAVFSAEELENFNRLNLVEDSKLERLARNLAVLQSLLAKRNITFLFIFSPNRLTLYPEIVLPEYVISSRRAELSNYDRLRPKLEQYGVQYLNGEKILREASLRTGLPMYGAGGFHYNAYAACIMAQSLVKRISSLSGRKLRVIQCDPARLPRKRGVDDYELVRISNLWRFSYPPLISPIPANKTLADGDEYQPSVFMEGTSFCWGLNQAIDKHRIFRNRDFYFYFHSHNTWPQKTEPVDIDRENVDWEKDVLSHDVFLLEVYDGGIQRTGHGIVEKLISYLTSTSESAS